MPQAMPSMVRAVRRRLWRIAVCVSLSRSRIMASLLPEGFYRFQHGCLARGIKTGDDSSQCQTTDRKKSRHRHQLGRIESARSPNVTNHRHQAACQSHSDKSADQREEQSLQEKMKQNTAI